MTNTSPQLLESLAHKAHQSRHLTLDMLTQAGSSHLGCSFSVIDIMTVLYHCFLDVTMIKEKNPLRDYFILSKGHAASGYYAILATAGLIDAELLKKYHQGGSPLAGHPMKDSLAGIEASTGSLGHGLSLAVGIALAAKNDNQLNKKIYVLVGDGECQEGSIWEAITMASRFKLNNLVVIVDYNNLQGLDKTDDLMPGTLEEKFKAFHCFTQTVDGHNYAELINAFETAQKAEKPSVIIARTIKGKGLSAIENKLEWHYKSFKQDQYVQAKSEIR